MIQSPSGFGVVRQMFHRGFKGFGWNFLILEKYLFKVGNFVEKLAFWLAFVRELLYTLSSPLVQNPLRKSLRNVDIEISISEPRNIDFQVGVDLMDPLQILLRSRKNHQNFEIFDFDKKSRNHFKCDMGTFSLKGGIPVVPLMGKGTALSKQAKNANFSTKYPTLNTDFPEMRPN